VSDDKEREAVQKVIDEQNGYTPVDEILQENHTHNKEVFKGEKVGKAKAGRPRNDGTPREVVYTKVEKPRGRPKKQSVEGIDEARLWEMMKTPYGFKNLLKMIRTNPDYNVITKFALCNVAQIAIHPDAGTGLAANKILLQHMNELDPEEKNSGFSFGLTVERSDTAETVKGKVERSVEEEANRILDDYTNDN